MSVELTCPHCRRGWMPSSRQEAASPVCTKCRATPAFATGVRADGPKVVPAGVAAASGLPRRPKAKSWPIVVVVVAGSVLFVSLAAATAGAAYFLTQSRKQSQPIATELAVAASVQTSSASHSAASCSETAEVLESVVTENPARKIEPPPAPKLEIKPETKPDPKPAAPAVADAKSSPPAQNPPPLPPFKRMRPAPGADDLVRQLYKIKEIELEKPLRNNVSRDLLVFAAQHRDELPRPTPPIFNRNDLAGMPMRMGMDCHLGKESAEALQILSRKLRVHMSEAVAANAKNNRSGVDDPRPNANILRGMLKTDGEKAWTAPEAVPTLVQILQAEDRPMRLLLVEMLSRIKCREATQALARRATFDVSDDVREAAVNALRDRPGDEVRETLLEGLRYPWPAAAEFAAEAFVNLSDKSAVPYLAKLLDDPDPIAPYRAGNGSNAGHYVREVVRVNHLRNCMMCHSPALGQNDLVRAPVPNQNLPLPPSFTPAYYQAPSSPGTMFVRADITYLKQDFAVAQAVASPGLWPAHQRYDYFVRTRQATAEKMAKSKSNGSYPQKDAVLFALRELTGEYHGDTTADWQGYLQRTHGNKN